MRRAVLVAVLVALAGCGADGPPLTPEAKANAGSGTNISVSGTVGIGVSGGG